MAYEYQVKKEDIKFKICAYINGFFNNPLAPDYSFTDAEAYFLMLYQNTGYMPQYGDGLWSDSQIDRAREESFIIVSKDFAVDDYCEIILCVVPEEVYYKQWK